VGRKQGHGDSPLTRLGVSHAIRYGERLREEISNASEVQLHASTLFRARQTASIVADILGLDDSQCAESPLLMEMDMGAWEGLTDEEIDSQYPGARQRRAAERWSWSEFGLESLATLYDRALHWLEGLEASADAVVVTHGRFSRALRGAALGLSSRDTLALDSHEHGRVFMLNDGKETALHV
jgi:probable phosphoglycerate mutase